MQRRAHTFLLVPGEIIRTLSKTTGSLIRITSGSQGPLLQVALLSVSTAAPANATRAPRYHIVTLWCVEAAHLRIYAARYTRHTAATRYTGNMESKRAAQRVRAAHDECRNEPTDGTGYQLVGTGYRLVGAGYQLAGTGTNLGTRTTRRIPPRGTRDGAEVCPLRTSPKSVSYVLRQSYVRATSEHARVDGELAASPIATTQSVRCPRP